MDTKPTILTFLLAVFCVTLFVMYGRDESGGERSTDSRSLLSANRLPLEDVNAIRLERRGETPLVFERRGNRWLQTEPFVYPMDAFSIRQFMTAAKELDVVGTIEKGAAGDLSALALEPPDAAITYVWPEGDLSLHLGRRGVAGRAYLRIADNPLIFVVQQDLHERAVDMDPKEWRDRRLFHDVSVDADSIEVQSGAVRIVLQRDRQQWMMVEPKNTRVDDLARDDLFETLGKVQLSGFVVDQPDDLAQFGLENPVASITVESSTPVEESGEIRREKSTQRLLVGAQIGVSSEDRFGMVEGRDTVVRLPPAAIGGLFRIPELLVDPTGSGVAPMNVRSIRISTDEHEFTLQRDLERWVAVDFDNVEVEWSTVDELLRQLTELRASRIEFRPYPSEINVATVTFFGFDRKPIDTVRIAQDPTNRNWALENGDEVLRYFPNSVAFPLTPAAFGIGQADAASQP